MTDEDHETLLKLIAGYRRGHVLLSGYSNPMYDRYLKKWKRYEIPISLSPQTFVNGSKKVGKRIEVVWSNK
jgi:hypothetical protein